MEKLMLVISTLLLGCSEKEVVGSGLTVSAENLEFGEQPIETEETQTITITNNDPATISVLSLSLTGVGTDEWKIDRGDDTELATDESLDIFVSFRPTVLGETEPDLQIRTTYEDLDKIYITLHGIGTESIADNDEDGFSPADGDCDDNNANRYPGAEEICDGKDNDCDGSVPADEADEDVDGFRLCNDDCDDTDFNVYPGAEEICDQKDSNCDDLIPDNEDFDGDGFTLCDGDCEDDNPSVWPTQPEVCDGVDNDCSGGVDDIDEDGDGYSPCLINGDCDDNNPDAYPIVLDGQAEEGGDGSLEDPYNNIQTALDNLDPICRTVVVMPGVYTLNLTWNEGFVGFNGGGETLEDVVLQGDGARIADISDGASMRFANLIMQNSQGNGDGGAIRVMTGGALDLENVILRNNAAIGDGGAVSIADGSLTLTDTVFLSNSSEDDGGAIAMLSSSLEDHGSMFEDNLGTRGGAIALDVSSAQLHNSHFLYNTARSTGGGISFSSGDELRVEGSFFEGNNSSEAGGALFIGNHTQESSVVRNNIFQGNGSADKGGAMAFSGSAVGLVVANNSFVDNQTPLQGAAMYSDVLNVSGLYIWSNIFYANDGNYAVYFVDGGIPSFGYNTAYLTTSVVPWYYDAAGDAGGNNELDPMFVSFSNDNDASNDDLNFTEGSPMIDTGPPNGFPSFYSQWQDADGSVNDRGHLGGQGAVQ